MRIIVNDASCLIDLRKADLLTAALTLPYRFVVPLPLARTELLEFTAAEWGLLQEQGLEILDLEPELVGRAAVIIMRNVRLSANDAFSLALAEAHAGSILLTGDQSLRRQAEENGVEVHGALWVTDQLEALGLVPAADLLGGLCCWRDDPVVFLPRAELVFRIERLTAYIGRLR